MYEGFRRSANGMEKTEGLIEWIAGALDDDFGLVGSVVGLTYGA